MGTPRPYRRLAAKLGVVAALFQALLFGWHHHDLPVSRHLPAVAVENPATPPQPADDEDGCEICQVLHHQTAANTDVPAAPPVFGSAVALVAPETVFVFRRPSLGFHATGPPLA